MSFFKKLTAKSDKDHHAKDKEKEKPVEVKTESQRRQTLVSELQKSSGLSVAFMTELKQKTEAIRLLKLENDEWSDEEDTNTPVGIDSVATGAISLPSPPSPKPEGKHSKKLDLKAVAARMGLKKRPKKEEVRSSSFLSY